MKKIYPFFVAACALAVAPLCAFDEDNVRAEVAMEAVQEVALAEGLELPAKKNVTVAMSDEELTAHNEDYTQFYDALAQLAQADVPATRAGVITTE